MNSWLINPNDVDADGSGRENVITVDFAIRNKETWKSKGDIKIGLEVQQNMATTAPVFNWPTFTPATLASAFSITVLVHRQLAPIYVDIPLLLWAQLLSHMLCAKSMALFVQFFENT